MSKARELLNMCEGSVLDQARSLSSVTIAGLIKSNKYSDIDKVQGEFVEFIMKKDPKSFKTWQDAWKEFDKGRSK